MFLTAATPAGTMGRFSTTENTYLPTYCGTAVGTSRLVPQGSPREPDLPAPTCTITQSARSCVCSTAWAHWSSVVTNHTGVGAWGRGGSGSGHATSALGAWCSPSASTSQRMYMRAAGGWYAAPCVGGTGCPDGGSPLRGGAGRLAQPRAGVGVLLSPRGVDEPQAGVPRVGSVEHLDYGIAPSGMVDGPLLAAAVVEVLIGALVEAVPHRCWPWVVVVLQGVVRPVVPVPGRRSWHRQATPVAVPRLGGTQRDDIAQGGLQLDVGHPGQSMGLSGPTPRAARARGMRWTQLPPATVANSGTG